MNRETVLAVSYVLAVLVVLALTGCTTTHAVYVSNGSDSRAGPNADLDADRDMQTEIIGIKQ